MEAIEEISVEDLGEEAARSAMDDLRILWVHPTPRVVFTEDDVIEIARAVALEVADTLLGTREYRRRVST